MKIAVFCSANDEIDPEYFRLTTQLGEWMAHEGHTLVFGGCDSGLMECVARAVKDQGGRTIGVIPSIVEQGGRRSRHLDVEIPCDDLSDRKSLLMDQADAFIALSGGIGTLDEIFTVAASKTIGYHGRPVILFNINGCWDALTTLLDDLQQRGLMRGSWRSHFIVADSLDDIQKALS